MKLSRAVLPFFILIIIVLALSGATAVASELDGLSRVEAMQYLFDQYKERATSLGEDSEAIEMHAGKCGFPAVMQLQYLRDHYGKVAGIDGVLLRPVPQNYPESFDSPGGHFKIHYTTQAGDNDAVDPSWGDNNSNGVNDYIDIVAGIADSVWEHHIDELGYIVPLSDGTLGGDARYDIYVNDLDPSYYGATYNDLSTQRSQSSWIEIDNHYERYPGYGDRPLDALRVTLAHEFTHALHLTYDISEQFAGPAAQPNTYWFEMHATWMEEEMYDNINDYYFYMPSYLVYAHKSPRYADASGLSIYGACLFPLFLSEKYGPDINRITWEKCAAVPYENFLITAVQDAVQEVSNGTDTFAEAWIEYTQWLYFTGSRARAGFGFEEAANYPEVPARVGSPARDYIHVWNEYPITASQSRDNGFLPSELGANFQVFRTASLDSTFGMLFQGEVALNPVIEWRISVVGFDRFTPTTPIRQEGVFVNQDAININDLSGITDLLIVPTIVNPEARFLNDPTFTYQFIVADSSIEVESDKIKYGPSPFHLAQAADDPFRISVQLRETQVVEIAFFSVAGEEVYSAEYDVAASETRFLMWDGRNNAGKEVASGVYILQIRVGESVEHHKILVL